MHDRGDPTNPPPTAAVARTPPNGLTGRAVSGALRRGRAAPRRQQDTHLRGSHSAIRFRGGRLYATTRVLPQAPGCAISCGRGTDTAVFIPRVSLQSASPGP